MSTGCPVEPPATALPAPPASAKRALVKAASGNVLCNRFDINPLPNFCAAFWRASVFIFVSQHACGTMQRFVTRSRSVGDRCWPNTGSQQTLLNDRDVPNGWFPPLSAQPPASSCGGLVPRPQLRSKQNVRLFPPYSHHNRQSIAVSSSMRKNLAGLTASCFFDTCALLSAGSECVDELGVHLTLCRTEGLIAIQPRSRKTETRLHRSGGGYKCVWPAQDGAPRRIGHSRIGGARQNL